MTIRTNGSVATRDLVVVGGSSGSLRPLRETLAALRHDFEASILVVIHGSRADRWSLQALGSRCSMPFAIAEHGMKLRPNSVYLAPPDRHLLVSGTELHVLRGPRENNCRPSIDVLFRSAAVHYSSRVIGVILSGSLSDGAAGLSAIARCGGKTVVQEPSSADFRELPEHALRATAVDHVAPAESLPELLDSLVREPAPAPPATPEDLRLEARWSALAMDDPARFDAFTERTHIVCPECSGPLARVGSGALEKFRCDVGHSFGIGSLLASQSRALERALWIALRTLRERSILLSRMADDARERGHAGTAQSYTAKVQELEEHARAIRDTLTAPWEPVEPASPHDHCEEASSE